MYGRTYISIAIIFSALVYSFFLSARAVSTPLAEHVATSSTASAIIATDSTPRLEPPLSDTYFVTKVVDGDTLAVSIAGVNTTLRLIGLDTPETVDPRKSVQCFGKEASDKAKELLSRKEVRIEYDPSQGALDKYGRTLAYVFLADGTLFNEYMIAQGYAHEYTYNFPYKYQAQFKAAENSARGLKLGLWADDACASQSSRTPAASTPLAASVQAGGYECTRNVYNCSSFKTQSEAQAAFDACGGDSNDIHKLDSGKDGKVCESLP
jgi:micrococcal nuclease